MMHPQRFPVSLKLRIDWSDLDYFKHVNNVSYFRFIQSARVNYWANIGLNQLYEAHSIGPMLASCKCDFKSPLYYPGEIEIRSGMSFMKHSSFGLTHQLFNEERLLAAVAEDVLVMFDFVKHEKCGIPDAVRDRMEALENRSFGISPQ